MKFSGAEILIHLLERQGISTIAGIPGGANLPMYDALGRSEQIHHVLCRHEQAAGFIAQGIARATGNAAVCFATSGPGATNLLTAIADAKMDSVPIVAITGQVATTMLGTDAFQEVDTFGMTMPIVKHNYLVKSAADLLTVIPQAFRIALSGRPGPVLIDVPKDVQKQMLCFDAWPEPGKADPLPEIPAAALEQAAAMINSAQRPVLYIGGGAMHSGAGEAIKALAEKAGIPVTMTLMGLGAIPTDHPQAIGMLGMHAARYTNMTLEASDLLIAVGVRFDDRAIGKAEEFCPNAGIIHIDIDAAEIHKIRQAHVPICADARQVLDKLNPKVLTNARREWLDHVQALKAKFPLQMPGLEDPLQPYGLLRAVENAVDDETIITTDVGQHQMWTAQAYPFRRHRQWLTSGGLGTMGFGMPAAIGAALACPDKTVICISGDGSLLMNIQDLVTAVEQDANIKIILMNNNTLGLVRQQQALFFEERIFAAAFPQAVDFIQIAQGFGMRAIDLGTSADIERDLSRELNRRGPCLIHVPIREEEMVFPMVPPGAANKDMIDVEAEAVET